MFLCKVKSGKEQDACCHFGRSAISSESGMVRLSAWYVSSIDSYLSYVLSIVHNVFVRYVCVGSKNR